MTKRGAIIWVFFVASVTLVFGVLWKFWRRSRGQRIVDFGGRPIPWQLDAVFQMFGAIGVASTVPGLFFDQPHWLIDHVWRVIGKIAGEAT